MSVFHMDIYIVEDNTDFEGSKILAVCTSLSLAKEICNSYAVNNNFADSLTISAYKSDCLVDENDFEILFSLKKC